VTDYCCLLAATKAAHTEGWLAYDPHHDRLSGTDRTTCQTPDERQPDQVKLPVFFLARRRRRR